MREQQSDFGVSAQSNAVRLRRERSQNQTHRTSYIVHCTLFLLLCAFAPSRAQIPINNTGTIILSDTLELQLINDISLLDSIKPIGPPWYTVNALGSKCTKQTLKRIKKPKEKAADKQYLLYY